MARRAASRGVPVEVMAGVTLTHPDKLLWPEAGLTKRDLARHYLAVAKPLLAWIADRPVSVLRMPDGMSGPSFFQRHPGPGMGKAIRRAAIAGQARPAIQVSDEAGLVALAQMAVIEIHPWGAPTADIDHPDRLVLDLDPDEALPFERVIAAAQSLRARLAAAGLVPFCRTSGGKSLHVVAPLARGTGWDAAKTFARETCEAEAASRPDLYTTKAAKAGRAGRIFLDYLRNDRGASAIANFSPRARPEATFAAPLAWEEVVPGLNPRGFTLRNAASRLKGTDPWGRFAVAARPLPAG